MPRFVLRLWPWLTVGYSMIVCTGATARTSSGSMSTSIVGKNFIGRRQRCMIDVLSQQMVWLLLHSQLRYSEHWHLDGCIAKYALNQIRRAFFLQWCCVCAFASPRAGIAQ